MDNLGFSLERANLHAHFLREVINIRQQNLELLLIRKLAKRRLQLDFQTRNFGLECRDVGSNGADLAELALKSKFLSVEPFKFFRGILVEPEEVNAPNQNTEPAKDADPNSLGQFCEIL